MQANKRIDAGIKRGPRKQINRQPRAASTGQFLPKFSPDQKKIILTEAYACMERGQTTDQIAVRHGITGRALRWWLLDDPLADQARRILINGELARTLDEMKEARLADSPLPLACAREEFRAWSWIAERRESRLYGQKQEVAVTHIGEEWGERLRRARERVIGSGSIKTVESAPALPVPDENDSQADV